MSYLPTGRELIDPFRLLKSAGVFSGMRVADCGCGTLGHYVFPAAQLVGPAGAVYAIDILKSVLNDIESRIKLKSINNVTTVWGDLERPKGVRLPDQSMDVVLLINNLFLSRQRSALIAECVRLLKPGGHMVVVDWKPSSAAFGPPASSRLAPEETRRLVEVNGLKLVETLQPGQYHYGFLYRRLDAAS